MTDTKHPEPPTADLDNGLGQLLRRIEAQGDQAGWADHNADLTVYVVYDHNLPDLDHMYQQVMGRMGEPVRNSRYTAQPMVPPRIFARGFDDTGSQQYELLRNFVVNIAYADDTELGGDGPKLDAFRGMLRLPGVLAFIARYETWTLDQMTREQLRASINGDKHFSENPASRQARMVLAVDAHDRVHRCCRPRGGIAELELDAPIRGDFSTSLRILMDFVYDRLPAANPEAFSARYPTLMQLTERGGTF